MQNNELVEANEKLLKEVALLRNLAKDAISEKKKSQTALETLRHQVVHMLGEHDMVPKQDAAKQDAGKQEAAPPTSTGVSAFIVRLDCFTPIGIESLCLPACLFVCLPACLPDTRGTPLTVSEADQIA